MVYLLQEIEKEINETRRRMRSGYLNKQEMPSLGSQEKN